MIYFDNAATTKPTKNAIDIFSKINAEEYFNPSAMYSCAFDLNQKINKARKSFLNMLGASESDQIIFTSGATESNNIAIMGLPLNKNGKYIFSIGEHPSVYNCAVNLKMRGYNVEFVPLTKSGEVDYDELNNMCDNSTMLVSTMFVSNETGAINDLAKIRSIISEKSPKAKFHVDCVQGFGKIPLNVRSFGIDLCSLSAHKIGSLKGCGTLYIKKGTTIKNIVYGGGQEYGIRSGTLNPPIILSFESSSKDAITNLEKNYRYVSNLKQYLLSKLNEIKQVQVVSSEKSSPYILSLLVNGHRGETIMRYLDSKGIIVGRGSACSAKNVGNRVLENMGYSKNQVMGSLRISFSATNTIEEIDEFIKELKNYLDEIDA